MAIATQDLMLQSLERKILKTMLAELVQRRCSTTAWALPSIKFHD